jgi:hypothetical protein
LEMTRDRLSEELVRAAPIAERAASVEAELGRATGEVAQFNTK